MLEHGVFSGGPAMDEDVELPVDVVRVGVMDVLKDRNPQFPRINRRYQLVTLVPPSQAHSTAGLPYKTRVETYVGK